MRPVLFLFYTVETLLNVILLRFNISGFMVHSLDFLPMLAQIFHISYTVFIHIVTISTLFASLSLCTGHTFSHMEEIVRSFLAFCALIFVSLMTLEDAENDFHLMYITTNQTVGVEDKVHPFFSYMRAQAVCALCCAVVYLLHLMIVLDVLLSAQEITAEEDFDDTDEADYVPVRLYFMGEMIETQLEQYEWFNDFNRNEQIDI